MTQKNETITTGLNALFGNAAQAPEAKEKIKSDVLIRKPGRPRKDDESTDIGEQMRTSIIVNKTVYDKIRLISIREGLTIKEVVHYAFQHAVESYEKVNGPIDKNVQHRDRKEIFG